MFLKTCVVKGGGEGGGGNPSHAALSSISLEKTKYKHFQFIVVFNKYLSSCQK